MKDGAKSRSGWTKIEEMYDNVHPNLVLVLLFVRTEGEHRKGLVIHFKLKFQWIFNIKREKEHK